MIKRWLVLFLLALPVVTMAQQDAAPAPIFDALDLLNQQLGTNLRLNDFISWSWVEEVYDDASLGCPQTGQVYAHAITRGYTFLFTYRDTVYDFRSTSDGSNVFFCTSYEAQRESATVAPSPEATQEETPVASPELTTEATQTSPQVTPESTEAATPEATAAISNSLPFTAGPITARNAEQVVELGQLTLQPGSSAVMAWSGNTIAVVGDDEDGSVWLYPLDGDEPQLIVVGEPVTALVLVPSEDDLTFMAAGGLNGRVIFVQVEPLGLDLIEMEADEDVQGINSIAVSPDLLVVATAVGSVSGDDDSDNAVYLWNTRTGGQLARLAHDEPVGAVAIRLDGTLLATGDQTGTVRVWELTVEATDENVEASAEVVETFSVQTDLIRALAFSPDGTKLAAGSMDGTALVWTLGDNGEADEDTEPLVLVTGTDDAVLALAFSPDGDLVATAGGNPNADNADNAIRLWDVRNGDLLATLTGHNATVGSIAFSPTGDLLASASDDGTVRLWGIPAAG